MDHRITTSTEKANRVPTFTESESSYARSGTENAFISQKQPKKIISHPNSVRIQSTIIRIRFSLS